MIATGTADAAPTTRAHMPIRATAARWKWDACASGDSLHYSCDVSAREPPQATFSLTAT